jgi:hypothetical protein
MTFKALKCVATAALLATAGAASAAGAATVTFDSLTNPGIWAYTGDTYTEQGMSFAATVRSNGYSLYAYGLDSPFNADVDGATLHQEFAGGFGIVAAPAGAGGTFTLTSFDLANSWNDASGGTVDFSYVDATGVHHEQLTLADQVGLQTFTFDLTGVRSFSLWSNDYQLDNVQVNDVIPVPEPESYALMLAGLAGLVGLSRRRKS